MSLFQKILVFSTSLWKNGRRKIISTDLMAAITAALCFLVPIASQSNIEASLEGSSIENPVFTWLGHSYKFNDETLLQISKKRGEKLLKKSHTSPLRSLEEYYALQAHRTKKYCISKPIKEIEEPKCIFPLIVDEFLKYGALIAQNSFDSDNLPLTLSGRLHRFDFFDLFQKESRIDVNISRFLIAQRMLQEISPYIHLDYFMADGVEKNYIHEKHVLTALTPFSFIEGMDYGNLVLSGFFETLQSRSELQEKIEATLDYTRPNFHTSTESKIYQIISNTVTGRSNGNMLIYSSSFNIEAMKVYLQMVEDEAGEGYFHLGEFSGQGCHDINLALDLIRKRKPTWVDKIKGEFSCTTNEKGHLTSAAGEALESLEQENLTWVFNFAQMRLMVTKLFDEMNEVDPIDMEKAHIHEYLKDVQRLASSPLPDRKQDVELSQTGKDLIRYHQSFLYKDLMSQIKRAEELSSTSSH